MGEDNPVPSTSEDTSSQAVRDISLAERELALKEREATLKEIETKYRLSLEKRNVWFTSPLLIAVFSALFGILGTAVGSILQGYWNFELERQKFEFSLIQKSLETEDDRLIGNHGDRQEAAKRLIFLVDSGIIESLDSDSIKKSAENPEQLPTFSGGKTIFVCKSINGIPTTVAISPRRHEVPFIAWKSNAVDSPEAMCNKVSSKLQDLQNKDKLNYFTTGIIDDNRYICSVSKMGEICEDTVFELKPTDDPEEVLRDLMNIAVGRSSSPLVR